jgi:hypothetical protein
MFSTSDLASNPGVPVLGCCVEMVLKNHQEGSDEEEGKGDLSLYLFVVVGVVDDLLEQWMTSRRIWKDFQTDPDSRR